jgi:regulator of sigma E protease
MNLIFAVIFFSAAEAVGKVEFRPVISQVEANSPAYAAGLRPGDTFITIDGHSVKYFSDVQGLVGADETKALAVNPHATTTPVVVEVRHNDGALLTETIAARINNPQGALGIEADQSNPYHFPAPIWEAPILGVRDVGAVAVGTVQGISQVIRGLIPAGQAISGPVGIVTITGQVSSAIPIAGPYLLLYLIGALNMSLAIMNLLLIPALDGGRVLFVLIEVLRRGKRMSPEREGLVNLIGMAAILLLVAVITFSDVSNLIIGH